MIFLSAILIKVLHNEAKQGTIKYQSYLRRVEL